MVDAELRSQLKAIVSKLIELDEFPDDARFVSDLGVDSMMGLEIVAQIEKRYHITIPEAQLIEMRTMNDVLRITEHALGLVSAGSAH
jgi:acyl carrier protein